MGTHTHSVLQAVNASMHYAHMHYAHMHYTHMHSLYARGNPAQPCTSHFAQTLLLLTGATQDELLRQRILADLTRCF